MNPITDKIRQEIEGRNLNKAKLSRNINMTRKSVYNLKDESVKLDTFLKICKELNLSPSLFLSEFEIQTNQNVLEEPSVSYGSKESELIKMLRSTISAQEKSIKAMEITISLLQKEALPKMKLEKKK